MSYEYLIYQTYIRLISDGSEMAVSHCVSWILNCKIWWTEETSQSIQLLWSQCRGKSTACCSRGRQGIRSNKIKTCWANGTWWARKLQKKKTVCVFELVWTCGLLNLWPFGGPVIQPWVYTRFPPFFPQCSEKAGGNPACWSRAQGLWWGFLSWSHPVFIRSLFRQETQAVAMSCPDARGKETIPAGWCRSVSWLIGWWRISNLEHVSWVNNVAGCSRRLTSCSDYSPMYHSNESKLCLLRVSADGQLQVMSAACQSIFQHTR